MSYLEGFRLTDRRAVVTGGGRGIGREICQALAEAGAKIVILEKESDSGMAAVAELRDAGYEATSRRVNVTDSSIVTEVADEVITYEGPVDILVNNAGVAFVPDPLATSDDEWNLTMSVNVDAAFWCARAFGRHMSARKSGCIVNIGSILGTVASRPQNSVPYIASKGAIHLLTKSLACALAPDNVRVNAVAPGYVGTDMVLPLKEENPDWFDRWVDMTPLGRLAEPREIASAVLFLSSDASSYCTGTILHVDGGYTAW